MAKTRSGRPSLVESLREHVLSPVSEAQEVARREHEEVDAEREAFWRFRDRVAGIDTVSPPPTVPKRRVASGLSDHRAVDRLRNAYRETVMDVPHYEDVYDEPLEPNFTAELAIGLPTGSQRDGTAFTDVYKSRLVAAIDQTLEQRAVFCDGLAGERDSLARGRDGLTDLLDELDGSSIPDWYSDEFEAESDEIVARRQETLRTRNRLGDVDGHDLCTYLYQQREWTYPVLTAVARLRSSVGYRSSTTDD